VTIKHSRIIDANLNRLREGIRVVEDIFRYEFNECNITISLKELRHTSVSYLQEICICKRDVINDCLKDISIDTEMNKININQIVLANLKRVQESSRVLEEMCKIYDHKESNKFKLIRYKSYSIEENINKFFTKPCK
jgi:thiamine-phosphate pyrophosphorylase